MELDELKELAAAPADGGIGSSLGQHRHARREGALLFRTPMPRLDEMERAMHETELLSRITIDPEKCGGRPCIRGMRIRVIDVLELLASSATWEQILEDYSYLEADDIAASLLYAARQLDHPIVAA
jgi:uncharacterized protein (DUF433 family)